MSAKTKYLSAVLAVVAVVATVAVARTLHAPNAPVRETVGIGRAAPHAMTPAPLHGIVACGGAALSIDCGEMEQLLPQ